MFVAAGATIVSFLVLLTMVKTKIGEFKGKRTFFTYNIRCFSYARRVSNMVRPSFLSVLNNGTPKTTI